MTTKFNPETYRSGSGLNDLVCIWGGGHTSETDPTRKGWRYRKVEDTGLCVYLIGQPGKEGCASIQHRGGDRGQPSVHDNPRGSGDGWDVAIYWETPEEVNRYLLGGDHIWDARYVQVEDVPGFGLGVIREIERERSMMAKCL